jgi:hypothetical protein
MKALRIIFGLYTVVCLIGAISGIQGVYNGHVIYYHGWQRLLPVVIAPVSAALCYGLTKQRLWAWHACLWLGYLLVLQILVYNLLVPSLSESDTFNRLWIVISQGLFAVVVFWGLQKWWVPKKAIFSPAPKPTD